MLGFHIKNYGCQMNVYDANKISVMLKESGYQELTDPLESDIVILYTCNIREKAIQKIYSDIGKLKHQKNSRNIIIAVGGCMAQQLGKEIFTNAKIVDIVFGPQNIHELPVLIQQAIDTKAKQLSTKFDLDGKFAAINNFISDKTVVSSFVTVQEGCNNFCTYCVVPYTRGPEHSRTVEDVISEIKRLAHYGTREVILLGQNVNSYCSIQNGKSYKLADLIYEIDKIDEIQRIRYTSSNPQNMSDDLIQAHVDIRKLMPLIHIPVQSGSNSVLKKMNRPYTREFYLELVQKIRSKVKNIVLSTDIIVGFPAETEDDFMQTIDLVQNVGYANAFYFKYSRRAGTPADAMDGQIPEPVKSERFAILDKEFQNQQLLFNKKMVNEKVKILFECYAKNNNFLYGKTEEGIACCAKIGTNAPSDIFGQIFDVVIKEAHLKTLYGELVPTNVV